MAETAQDSSRIFVKNLPPTITQADFEAHLRKHFSNGHITDIKLIPQRRIGYVGYKSNDEAKQAVTKFHRSFIRMSKVSVELARPIADPSLPNQRFQARTDRPIFPGTTKSDQADTQPAELNQKKRKLNETDESDPKLQEYLDVMQRNPAKKPREEEHLQPEQPPVVEAESDDEYEEVPSRKARLNSRATAPHTTTSVPPTDSHAPEKRESQSTHHLGHGEGHVEPEPMDLDDAGNAENQAAPATDDDWLRSRTNRLLDLVDADEVPIENTMPESAPGERKKSIPVELPPREEEEEENAAADQASKEPASKQEVTKPKESAVDTVHKTARIFVRNLPYTADEAELREFFGAFGEIEEIHVPASSGNANNQGIAFVSYVDSDDAVKAFQQADGATFQGRMIHVLPGSAKREQLDEYELSKLPLKVQNKIRKKAKAGQAFNWNSLYMNQDAVLTSTADRLGVSKSELLDPTNADAAVKQALAETSTIQDTKAYFLANGVDLESFKSGQRSQQTILVKNLPYPTSTQELRSEFEQFGGQILKVLMPPTGTIAIVHFASIPEGKTAFSKLAYRRFKNSIFFLEQGPKGLFAGQTNPTTITAEPVGTEKLSAAELLEGKSTDEPAESSSIFVKNLSFNTTTAHLHDAFKHLDGYRSSSVKTKSDSKKPGQVLSMGFGFVSFNSKTSAEAAAKSMDGQVLHAHKLVVRTSHRGQDAAEQRRKEDAAKKADNKSTKLILKNLAFEVGKKDVRSLLGTYGTLRSVRLPKNAQNRSKGYAFAEFVTSREAENALNALRDTHLLGRKLVLDFAEAEEIDPEEVIAKMAKKTGRQNAKVTLHQLTGGDRKKITIGNEEEGEGEF
ncbi:multiple RNA-binding domain-containing protein [Truncatella angustata]|uniref:Multiple RNA-binding domain-containing protein n=1 Tax=Truncatella angustata TaxID=152316 RepID=A0A9P9A024_9PEZI|nr:multiple RNA-binding domain-containing protein [Truncatella angustata]KAH6657872.1 multiple RNA-binding domain-containing protein [Truncatella angustata]